MKDKRLKWTETQDWYLENLTYFTDEALSCITGKTVNEIQQRRHYKKKVLVFSKNCVIIKG